MNYKRVFNFNAGPAALPEPVLESLRDEMMNFQNSGISVMEMSHRSKQVIAIMKEAESLLRELMGISENYSVLFLQGGASQQFAMVPMNFLIDQKPAAVLHTGYWTKKALSELKKIGSYKIVASSEEINFTALPDCQNSKITGEEYSYLYLCSNNTIYGTQWKKLPPVVSTAPIIADMSSDILSRQFNVNEFGAFFAGAQKNIGPSGLTVAVIRKDLLDRCNEKVPSIFQYKAHAEAESAYNTPPVYSIFVALKVLQWLKNVGGVAAIEKINNEKAALIYNAIDEDEFYTSPINKTDRSHMNVVFMIRNGNEELESKFAKESEAAGLSGLKGHRAIGGLRASIYNAQPLEGVSRLVDFMKEFSKKNK